MTKPILTEDFKIPPLFADKDMSRMAYCSGVLMTIFILSKKTQVLVHEGRIGAAQGLLLIEEFEKLMEQVREEAGVTNEEIENHHE